MDSQTTGMQVGARPLRVAACQAAACSCPASRGLPLRLAAVLLWSGPAPIRWQPPLDRSNYQHTSVVAVSIALAVAVESALEPHPFSTAPGSQQSLAPSNGANEANGNGTLAG